MVLPGFGDSLGRVQPEPDSDLVGNHGKALSVLVDETEDSVIVHNLRSRPT